MLGPLERLEQLDRPEFRDRRDREVRRESRVTPAQLDLQDRRVRWVKMAELVTRVKLVRRVRSAVRVLLVPLGHQEALERPVKLAQLAGPVPQASEVAPDHKDPWVMSDRWVLLDPRVQLGQVDRRVNRDLSVSRVHLVLLDLRDPWDSLDLLAALELLEVPDRLETREKLDRLELPDQREARDQQDQLGTRGLPDNREQLELRDLSVA